MLSSGNCRSIFQRDCRLPFNNAGMVEGWHHHALVGGCEFPRGGITDIENIADKFDFDEFSAKGARLVDFLLRRGDWHENHALAPEMPADECKALRMIAGGSTDENGIFICCFNGFGNKIEGTAQLVGAHRRQVFAFQPNLRTIFPRQIIVALQWRFAKERAHCLFCLGHGFDEGGHHSAFWIFLQKLPQGYMDFGQ